MALGLGFRLCGFENKWEVKWKANGKGQCGGLKFEDLGLFVIKLAFGWFVGNEGMEKTGEDVGATLRIHF